MKDILRSFRRRRSLGRRITFDATRGKDATVPQQVPPFWANGTPAVHVLKNMPRCGGYEHGCCHPPGAQDVFVSSVGKMFLLLSHKFSWFVCFARILRSLLF